MNPGIATIHSPPAEQKFIRKIQIMRLRDNPYLLEAVYCSAFLVAISVRAVEYGLNTFSDRYQTSTLEKQKLAVVHGSSAVSLSLATIIGTPVWIALLNHVKVSDTNYPSWLAAFLMFSGMFAFIRDLMIRKMDFANHFHHAISFGLIVVGLESEFMVPYVLILGFAMVMEFPQGIAISYYAIHGRTLKSAQYLRYGAYYFFIHKLIAQLFIVWYFVEDLKQGQMMEWYYLILDVAIYVSQLHGAWVLLSMSNYLEKSIKKEKQ